MHITGSHYRLFKLLSQPYDPLVQLLKLFYGIDRGLFIPQHKFVVSQRLDLQIIVEIHQPCDLFFGSRAHQRLIQLSRLTGRTQEQALPMLCKHALGNPGPLGIIIQMGPGYQTIQIYPTNFIKSQDNSMISRKLFDSFRIQGTQGIDLIQVCDILLLQHIQEFQENLCSTACIIHSPVMIFQRNVQCPGYRVQFKSIQAGQQYTSQPYRIHSRIGVRDPLPLTVPGNKAGVKARIVSHQHRSFTELHEFGQYIFDHRRIQHHGIVDTRQVLYLIGNGGLRINKGAEPVCNSSVLHLYRSDLNDPVSLRRKARGLQVKDHIGALQALAFGIRDDLLHIVHQIGLHTVNQFEAVAPVQGMAGFCKGLHHTMICNGQSRMTEGLGLLHNTGHIRNSVHITHFCMTMELHTLFLAVVLPLFSKIRGLHNARHGTNAQFLIKGIQSTHAADLQEGTFFNMFLQARQILVRHKYLAADGIGKIRQRNGQNGPLAADLPFIQGNDLSMNGHFSHLSYDLIHGNQIIGEILSVNHIWIVRTLQRSAIAACCLAGFCGSCSLDSPCTSCAFPCPWASRSFCFCHSFFCSCANTFFCKTAFGRLVA